MSVFTQRAEGEAMHVIRQADGGCEGCSLFRPEDAGTFPDLYPLTTFRVREKDPPLHEVFLVRMTDGDLAAVCLYCPWGVVFDVRAGLDGIAETAVAHVRAQPRRCTDCELGFRDEEAKDRHDLFAHGDWNGLE